MSENEKRRSMVFRRVGGGALSLSQAATVLGLSYRQVKRVWKRYREEGDEGLAHRNKGKPSNRAFLEGVKNQVLHTYREAAMGTGPTRFAGKLAEGGIVIDHETLRRWLLESGAWKLSRIRHMTRATGPCRGGFGELLTLFSMHESWLGAAFPPCSLLCLRDEATSHTAFTLAVEDSGDASMRVLWSWIDRHGLPAVLRCQRRFVTDENRHLTLEQQLAGREPRTALGLSCDRLGIDMRVVSSSQVKSVLHEMRPLLDSLVNELRRRGVAGLEQANALLHGAVGDLLNAQFAARLDEVADHHVPIVDGTDLRRFFCIERDCRLGSDGIVAYGHRWFRLMNGFGSRPTQPLKVLVSEWLDGSFHIFSEGKEIPFIEIPPIPGRPDKLAI